MLKDKLLLILASNVTGCVYISAFASLAGIDASIASSTTLMKVYAITAGIKKSKLIIKKTKKKHDKIELLAKAKLKNIEVLSS